jgi:putative transposase
VIFFDEIELLYDSKRRHDSSVQMTTAEIKNQYYQWLRSINITLGNPRFVTFVFPPGTDG